MSNGTPLSSAEKLDALKHMSTTNRQIHEERIKRELQVVITTLSFFAVSIALKLTNSLPSDSWFRLVVCLGFLGLAIGVHVYMQSSGDANRYNQKQAEKAEDSITALLKNSGIDIEIKPDHPCRNRWLWQSVIVLLGAVLSIIVLTTK